MRGGFEYGHRMVTGGYNKLLKNGKTRGPGKVHDKKPFIRAYPFIRPAFMETQDAVTNAMSTTLAEEIEKTAGSK